MSPCISRNSRRLSALLLFLFLCSVSFVAVNIAAALFGSSHALDLTASGRYTLSSQTLQLLKQTNGQRFARLYISKGLDESRPDLALYSQFVIRFLEQYKANSEHNFNLEIIEVEPFSASETAAQKQGLTNFIDSSGQNQLYFGLVLSNEQGESFSIPYLEPLRQAYLEHDITRLLSKLSGYKPKTVGIISPVLDLIQKPDALDSATDWPFIKQLRQDYELEYIASDRVQVPYNIDALIVVNPVNIPTLGRYAIDQYLLRGGKILIFMDPFSEAYLNLNGHISSSPSGLKEFLANLGVNYAENQVAGDSSHNQKTLLNRSADEGHSQIGEYPLWLDLDSSLINPIHHLTTGFTRLNLKSTGYFDTKAVLSAKVTPLFSTSKQGGRISANAAKYSSKAEIVQAYKNNGEKYNLAVLLEGKFPSFYNEHPLKGTEYENILLPFLITSIEPGKLLLVGDSDMLYTPNWSLGSTMPIENGGTEIPFNNNIDFVERAVDYLTGSSLISLAPKENFGAKATPGQVLNNLVTEQYADELKLYELNLRKTKLEQTELEKQISDSAVFPSVTIVKKVELLRREHLTFQDKLKHLRYKIQINADQRRNWLILKNTVVYPGILLALLWGLTLLLRRMAVRRARSYINE